MVGLEKTFYMLFAHLTHSSKNSLTHSHTQTRSNPQTHPQTHPPTPTPTNTPTLTHTHTHTLTPTCRHTHDFAGLCSISRTQAQFKFVFVSTGFYLAERLFLLAATCWARQPSRLVSQVFLLAGPLGAVGGAGRARGTWRILGLWREEGGRWGSSVPDLNSKNLWSIKWR